MFTVHRSLFTTYHSGACAHRQQQLLHHPHIAQGTIVHDPHATAVHDMHQLQPKQRSTGVHGIFVFQIATAATAATIGSGGGVASKFVGSSVQFVLQVQCWVRSTGTVVLVVGATVVVVVVVGNVIGSVIGSVIGTVAVVAVVTAVDTVGAIGRGGGACSGVVDLCGGK